MSVFARPQRPALPYPPVLLRTFVRSVAIWLLARALYVIVLFVGVQMFPLVSVDEGIAFALHPVLPVRLVIAALTAVLLYVDRRHAREILLQSNLGVSPVWFAATSFLGAMSADVLVQAILRTLGPL